MIVLAQVALFATVVGGAFLMVEVRHYARGYRDTRIARLLAKIIGR